MASFGQQDKPAKRFGEDDPVEVVGEAVTESLESVGRRALDAFTLGFGDEIIAGAKAAFGDEDFGAALSTSEARTQAFQEQARERAPMGIDPAEWAGLATGGGALLGGARMIPGVSRLPGLARTAIGGGVVGGTAAAGTPGTLEERALRVPTGAAVGAVAAPVAGGVAQGVIRGAGAVGRQLGRFAPGAQARTAREEIARAIARDETTPEAMAQRLQAYGPQAVIADVAGPNVMDRGYIAAELQGPGRALAERTLTGRGGREQAGRVSDALREAMEEQRSFHTVRDELIEQRSTAARPLYENVRAQQIQPTDRMREMLDRGSVKKAYKYAKSFASEDGIKLPTLKQLREGEADITGLQTWDYIKRGLDEHVQNLRASARRGKRRGMYAAANETRRELLGELDEIYPPYAEARAAWAGPSRAMEMMEEGRDIFSREDPEDFIAAYNRLDEGEKDFFRLGVVQEITKRIGDLAENRNAAQFWTSPNRQRKLAALFPGEQNLSQFMDRMIGETRAIETTQQVLRGSPTAGRQARGEQAALEALPGIIQTVRDVAIGRVGPTVERGARALAARKRIPVGQRAAEAEILFEPNRARQLELLEMLGREGRGARLRGRLGGAAAAGVGGAAAGAGGRSETTRRIADMLLGGS